MLGRVKAATLAALCSVMLSIGLGTPPPAEAQQLGLVNVSVGDVTTGDILSNNTVALGAAANIAANVCNIPVQVGVLAAQLQSNGSFRCQNNQTLKFAQITK